MPNIRSPSPQPHLSPQSTASTATSVYRDNRKDNLPYSLNNDPTNNPLLSTSYPNSASNSPYKDSSNSKPPSYSAIYSPDKSPVHSNPPPYSSSPLTSSTVENENSNTNLPYPISTPSAPYGNTSSNDNQYKSG